MALNQTQLQGASQTINTIAEQIKALQQRVATEGVTNAQGVQIIKPTTGQGATFNLPDVKTQAPDISSSTGRIDYFTNLLTETQKANEALQKQQAETQKTQQSWFDKLMNKPTLEQTQAQAYSDIGIKPAEYFAEQKAQIAEVQKLKEEYDLAVQSKELALSNEQSRLASMDVIGARMSRVERDANIRLNTMAAGINTKLAIMEIEKGNFNEAQDFVKTAAENYTYDLNLQYKQFETFRSMNQETLKTMSSTYQDLFDKSFRLAETTYTEEKNRYEKVLGMQVQYPKAGILATDSLEVASAKAGQYQGNAGQGLVEQQVGNFIVLRDAQGNIISTREKSTGGISGTSDLVVNQILSGAYLPPKSGEKKGSLDISIVNSMLEGYDSADKVAIKNSIYEKIKQIENPTITSTTETPTLSLPPVTYKGNVISQQETKTTYQPTSSALTIKNANGQIVSITDPLIKGLLNDSFNTYGTNNIFLSNLK